MASITDDPLIRFKDVPALLGVSRRTLNYWREKGLLPEPIELGPRAKAYRKSTIDAFLVAREGGRL